MTKNCIIIVFRLLFLFTQKEHENVLILKKKLSRPLGYFIVIVLEKSRQIALSPSRFHFGFPSATASGFPSIFLGTVTPNISRIVGPISISLGFSVSIRRLQNNTPGTSV